MLDSNEIEWQLLRFDLFYKDYYFQIEVLKYISFLKKMSKSLYKSSCIFLSVCCYAIFAQSFSVFHILKHKHYFIWNITIICQSLSLLSEHTGLHDIIWLSLKTFLQHLMRSGFCLSKQAISILCRFQIKHVSSSPFS